MKHQKVMSLLLTATLLFAAQSLAANQLTTQEQVRVQERTQEQIYGSQMMSEQERYEYNARIRAAGTAEERQRIRNEHHQRMQERAKAQGMTLPHSPPVTGGMGMGQGNGMGQGGGMKSGKGGGR